MNEHVLMELFQELIKFHEIIAVTEISKAEVNRMKIRIDGDVEYLYFRVKSRTKEFICAAEQEDKKVNWTALIQEGIRVSKKQTS